MKKFKFAFIAFTLFTLGTVTTSCTKDFDAKPRIEKEAQTWDVETRTADGVSEPKKKRKKR